MKKANKEQSIEAPSMEIKRIPRQIKDQLKPIVHKLLNKCSNMKTLAKKLEWDEFKEIFDLLQTIQQIEKNYTIKFPDRNDHWNEFYEWCSLHGAEFNSIKVKKFSDQNFGVVAETNIKEDELFLKVPRKIMMSEYTAKSSKLGPLIIKDPILQHMPNVQVALHLLIELLNSQSFWKPYISILPSRYNTILYFTYEEIQELQGSPVVEEVIKIYRSVARQYCYFFQLFQNDSYANSLDIGIYFTYDLYRWAASTVMTRQNSIPSFDGQSNITALIPLFDMCNHANGKLSTDFNLAADTLLSYASRTFSQGDEVYMFYGPRTNAEFFVHNAFVFPENECDALEIKLGISKNDPLFLMKKELCSKLNVPLNGSFKLHKKVPINDELLTFLKITVMKSDELDEALKNSKSNLDASNDLKSRALSFLKDRAFLLLKSYKTTLQEDEDLIKLSANDSENKKLAIQLRLCEKQILKNVINYCTEAC